MRPSPLVCALVFISNAGGFTQATDDTTGVLRNLTIIDDNGQAPDCTDSVPFARVKAVNPVQRALLRHGYDRSATFRQLIADIEGSSWMVFVQTGRCPEKTSLACLLHFVGQFDGSPYVRVIVNQEQRHPDNVIASLAHELRHALEIIQAVNVHSAADVRDLFRRIGWVSVKTPEVETYETKQAVDVGEAVRRELMNQAFSELSRPGLRRPHGRDTRHTDCAAREGAHGRNLMR